MHRQTEGLVHRQTEELVHRQTQGLVHRQAEGLVHRQTPRLVYLRTIIVLRGLLQGKVQRRMQQFARATLELSGGDGKFKIIFGKI